MEKHLPGIFLAVLVSCSCLAQTDSTAMLAQLTTMANDSNKVLFLLEVGDLYEQSEPERAAQYYHQARELARRVNYPFGVGKSWMYLGYLRNVHGQYAEGIESNQHAYDVFAQSGDSLEMAKALTNIGNSYLYQAAYALSLPFYIQAAELFERKKELDLLLFTLGNIHTIYANLNDVPQQLVYSQRMVDLAPLSGDSVMLTDAYQKFGLSLLNAGRFAQAKPALTQALVLAQQTADPISQTIAYSNMGEFYFRQQAFREAAPYFRQALEKAREFSDPIYLAEALHDMGKNQLALNQLSVARTYLREALAVARHSSNQQICLDLYATLGQMEETAQDFQQSAYYWRRHALLQDTVFDQNSRNQVAALDIRYQTTLRENRIQSLETENELQQLRLRQRSILLLLLLGGIAVLLSLLYLFRRNTLQRQEISRQAAVLQQQEIDRLERERNLVALRARIAGERQERLRISEDLHDDFGSGLSKIALLSDLVAGQNPNVVGSLQKIAATSRQLQRKMGEIVWALNTGNDSLASLVAYLRRYLAEFFADTPIAFHFEAPATLPDWPLSGEQRRHIFLVVKEALHNVLKHSQAQHVMVQTAIENNHLSIWVKDDGQGIPPHAATNLGHGLRNMEKRTTQLGGTFAITHSEGTIIHLRFPVSALQD